MGTPGNKTGKGGFGENPQNINRNGAPPGARLNLTNILKEKLEEVPEGQKESYKNLFIRRLLKKAMVDNDFQAMKLIINYVDGMPTQKIENINDPQIDKTLEILRDAIGKTNKTVSDRQPGSEIDSNAEEDIQDNSPEGA